MDGVLLPYQQRWLGDKSPVRIAEKSRRIGWSWSSAAEATLDAASTNGCDTWYVGYNKDMAIEFIRDCATWAREFNAVCSEISVSIFKDDDPEKQILTYSVSFSTGWRITALSSRPTNLRGKRGHIIIDEAAFHDDLRGLIKAAMAVLMWGGKARVDIISTHNGTENFFNVLVEECRAEKRSYSLHRCTIDDALEEGLFKRICLVNKKEWSPEAEAEWREQLFKDYGDDADEELLCIPARSGGTYISAGVIERQMRDVPVIRLDLDDEFVHWSEKARKSHIDQWCKEHIAPLLAKLNKKYTHFFGEDFGRTTDRTVMVPGYTDQKLVRKTPFVVEMKNTPYQQQEQVCFYIIDGLPNFAHGAFDATGNGAYLAEAAALRYNAAEDKNTETQVIEQVKFTEQKYAEILPPFKAALEDKEMELAKDADHLIDISAFKVINGLPKLPKLKTKSVIDGQSRHGDAGVAYALMHYASKLPVRSFGYQGVTKRDQQTDQTRIQRDIAVTMGWKNQKGGAL